MATLQAQKRLTREYKNIQQNPPPYIIARPNDHNILEWHYLITGPAETVYEGGQYHGTLTFQRDYPFKPPAIRMITPSGRFKTNTRLCLSMSDYHPDTWNPAWSVATILTGLLSFMTSEESTTGSIQSTVEVRKALAKKSKSWNIKENAKFLAVFQDLIVQNERDIREDRLKEAKKKALQKLMESSQKETPIDIEKITDPEDKLRAVAMNEAATSKAASKGTKSSWLYSIIIVIIIAMCAKIIKN